MTSLCIETVGTVQSNFPIKSAGEILESAERRRATLIILRQNDVMVVAISNGYSRLAIRCRFMTYVSADDCVEVDIR